MVGRGYPRKEGRFVGREGNLYGADGTQCVKFKGPCPPRNPAEEHQTQVCTCQHTDKSNLLITDLQPETTQHTAPTGQSYKASKLNFCVLESTPNSMSIAVWAEMNRQPNGPYTHSVQGWQALINRLCNFAPFSSWDQCHSQLADLPNSHHPRPTPSWIPWQRSELILTMRGKVCNERHL